jgi:hypothetical protein
MLPFPTTHTDALQLGDWLELAALGAGDKNASAGDLERELRLRGAHSGPRQDDLIEAQCINVFSELENRSTAAGTAYPFEVTGSVLQARDDWAAAVPYLFCLCLSHFTYAKRQRQKKAPERLFEHLARVAAGRFIQGQAVRFAAPRDRDDFPGSFRSAVDKLCREIINEGDGCRPSVRARQQDDGVDIVAWRDFPDRAPGKLLMFGNCASGRNWKSKLHELRPSDFYAKWVLGRTPTQVLKSLFIPYRVERGDWDEHSIDAGIIFDRCRIAHWASGGGWDAADHSEWVAQMLAKHVRA